MKLCSTCLDNAYRRARLVMMFTDAEITNPAFIVDFRAFASSLGISPERWPDYAVDLYRDFDGFIRDYEGHLIRLNTQHLEVYPEWWRDWVNTPVEPGIVPRLRKESKARVRVLATILKIAFPDEAAGWGLAPANDNEPGGRVRLIK